MHDDGQAGSAHRGTRRALPGRRRQTPRHRRDRAHEHDDPAAAQSGPPLCEQVDPDDPDALVEAAIYWYPQQFESRTDVLTHVLLGVGHGFTWDGHGRIVSAFRDFPELPPPPGQPLAGPAPVTVTDLARTEVAAADHLEDVRAGYRERARTHGPVKVNATAGLGAHEWSLLATAPDEPHPAWAAVVAQTRAELDAAWAVQRDAEAVRVRELESDRLASVVRLVHEALDRGCVDRDITPREHTRARAALAGHGAPARPEVDVHRERAEVYRRLERLLEIIDGPSPVEPGVEPESTETGRQVAEVLTCVVERQWAAACRSDPAPVPDLRHTDLGWLRAQLPNLLPQLVETPRRT